MMLNKATLIGNLGRDPEVRHTQSGGKVCNLSLATTEKWRKDGEMQERTEWHRIVIFDEKLCDVAEKYLSKGSKVYLEGQIQTRKWTDSNNVEKYSTEIVLQRFGGKLLFWDSTPIKKLMLGEKASQPVAPAGGPDLSDEIPFASHRGL